MSRWFRQLQVRRRIAFALAVVMTSLAPVRGEVKWVRDARYGVTGEQFEFGSTLKSVQEALVRRGYSVKGAKLSLPSLWNKSLPAIVLLKEGHFVIVERIADGAVETWDPDVDHAGADGPRQYSWVAFEKAWTGMALVLE